MTVLSTTDYFEHSNHTLGIIDAQRIASDMNLSFREEAKIYGGVPEDSEYSEKFVDWSGFTADFLKTRRNAIDNPLYSLWIGIKTRCYNSKSIGYAYYGEKGIRMHEPWKEDFTKFAEYVIDNLGKKPKPFYTIDRIDGNKNYEPGNIRWVAPLKQCRNKTGNGVKITEKNGIALAYLYKYFNVTGYSLKDIYNNHLAESDERKISKGWAPIYSACKSYNAFV